jgi:thiol:disulfide interchange protein DsbC
MFSDPFCPFCRRLDQNLTGMDNVTVYTFLYPILRKDESPAMSARIWCSPDRAKAYYDLMLRNREPSPVAGCKAPVDKWLALGAKLGISATPVSYVGSGARIIGARYDELQRLIDEPAAR